MKSALPSIFNDVIGPVMRGPSSSHTAASWRIARLSLSILNDSLEKAIIEFDKEGAWASNYREQGTAMGVNAGLLGLDMVDERMKDTEGYARELGIPITYEINSFETSHANTIRLNLYGVSGKKVQVLAVSLGGGSFEIQTIDGYNVSIRGNYYELLFKANASILDKLKANLPKGVEITTLNNEKESMYELKSNSPYSNDFLDFLKNELFIQEIVCINPIMPIISGNEIEMPFSSIDSIIDYADKYQLSLGDIGLIYEKCMSGLSEKELIQKMDAIVSIIDNSIEIGLAGTHYDDRILHQQSHLIEKAEKDGKILKDAVINKMIANVTALMESKSAMEVIVAAPTAGSCGALGGALNALANQNKLSKQQKIKAYFASGLIGAYFAMGPGFLAEEHGCQVECGAASGMAAAGIVELFGGSAKQALSAASMAIQNMIGLVCDPVADRVEVPCLGKNVSAAVNAWSSAIMATSGFDQVIPLDQVIETVSRVSAEMPNCVKCTGKGGLSVTQTANELKNKLLNNYE